MSDLISRSAVLEILENEFNMAAEEREDADNEKDRAFNAGEINCARRSRRKVKDLPAVDAVPVVHARWIYSGEVDEDGNCEANCSHCGAGDKHRADLKDAVPYCWKCGARMDGEEHA